MKTILLFTESSEKRKVLLKHEKDVYISREKIENEDYVVIRFPNGKVNMDDLQLRRNDVLGVGFSMNVNDDRTELFFFDRNTFTWNLSNLEKIGLFNVTQRHIPDEDDYYAYYINANGMRQWGYNAFFMTLQWIREKISKNTKNKKELG